MTLYLSSELPTVYADMNVYRYVGCGDIFIHEPERFIWVYSNVHLDEISRSGNKDALEGMRLLRAVEIADVLSEKFLSIGNLTLRDYINPTDRFEQYLEAIAGYEDLDNSLIEFIIHLFGADNFQELSMSSSQLYEEVEHLTRIVEDDRRVKLLERATATSERWQSFIKENLNEQIPIDNTRKAFGITSEHRKNIEKDDFPIDTLWRLIAPLIPNVNLNQFFGFNPIYEIENGQHTQHGSTSGAHILLNMLGISPDKGLSKREKIKNIMSDGQHIGMASYCNVLVSADTALINKAKCIYNHLGGITDVLHFNYQKDYVLNLKIK